MMDTASAAAKLYAPAEAAPEPTPDPAPEVLPEAQGEAPEPIVEGQKEQADGPLTVEQVQTALHDNVPDDIRAQREADDTRRMYDAQTTYRDVVNDGAFLAAGLAPEVAQLVVAEIRETLADLGLSANEARVLVADCEASSNTERDAKTLDAWRDAATEALNKEFGQGAFDALKAARGHVQRDPRLARILSETGAGDHPGVVLAIARGAMRQRGKR